MRTGFGGGAGLVDTLDCSDSSCDGESDGDGGASGGCASGAQLVSLKEAVAAVNTARRGGGRRAPGALEDVAAAAVAACGAGRDAAESATHSLSSLGDPRAAARLVATAAVVAYLFDAALGDEANEGAAATEER